MKIKSYIIKVKFPGLVEGEGEHYFGSLSAIYDRFSPNQIGCGLETLWKAKIEPGKPKRTRRCVISKHELFRKSQRSKENKQ